MNYDILFLYFLIFLYLSVLNALEEKLEEFVRPSAKNDRCKVIPAAQTRVLLLHNRSRNVIDFLLIKVKLWGLKTHRVLAK